MKHFVIFFHIVSILTGISAITLSYVAYIRYKNKVIKYFGYFLISMGVLILEQMVTTYYLVNNIQSNKLTHIVSTVSYMSCCFMIYIIPLFFHRLLDLDVWEKRKRLYKCLGVLPIGLLLLSYFYDFKNIYLVGNIILFSVIIHIIYLFYRYNQNIEKDSIRAIFKGLFVFTIFFFPYMFLDTKTQYIKPLAKHFPYGLLSVPIFYLVFNGVSLYYVIGYIKNRELVGEGTQDKKQEEDRFYTQYNITNREREVIALLSKGYSYQKIADELIISLATVKTHIRNIYQKTEVKNKIELLNLLR